MNVRPSACGIALHRSDYKNGHLCGYLAVPGNHHPLVTVVRDSNLKEERAFPCTSIKDC